MSPFVAANLPWAWEATGDVVPHHFIRQGRANWDHPERAFLRTRPIELGPDAAAIGMTGAGDPGQPQLRVRQGVDARRLVLADPR